MYATTEIAISDCGMSADAKYDNHEGNLIVVNSGGTPMARLLALVDFDTDDLDAIANDVLDAWTDGYEGDPAEAGLRVVITRDFETATATA